MAPQATLENAVGVDVPLGLKLPSRTSVARLVRLDSDAVASAKTVKKEVVTLQQRNQHHPRSAQGGSRGGALSLLEDDPPDSVQNNDGTSELNEPKLDESKTSAGDGKKCSNVIRISGAEEQQPYRMGLFSRPVWSTLPLWRNVHGQYLHFQVANREWRIGPDPKNMAAGVASNDGLEGECPFEASYWYINTADGWQNNSAVKAQPEVCQMRLNLTSSQITSKKYFGEYYMIEGRRDHYPVWRCNLDSYLFLNENYCEWRVGESDQMPDAILSSVATGQSQNGCMSLCPPMGKGLKWKAHFANSETWENVVVDLVANTNAQGYENAFHSSYEVEAGASSNEVEAVKVNGNASASSNEEGNASASSNEETTVAPTVVPAKSKQETPVAPTVVPEINRKVSKESDPSAQKDPSRSANPKDEEDAKKAKLKALDIALVTSAVVLVVVISCAVGPTLLKRDGGKDENNDGKDDKKDGEKEGEKDGTSGGDTG